MTEAKKEEIKPFSKEDYNDPNNFHCAKMERRYPLKELPCVKNPKLQCICKPCREYVMAQIKGDA